MIYSCYLEVYFCRRFYFLLNFFDSSIFLDDIWFLCDICVFCYIGVKEFEGWMLDLGYINNNEKK